MIRNLGDPSLHFFLTRGVARAMGIGLSDALRTGDLTPDDYAGMVTRCRGCALVETCQAWLARSHGYRDSPPEGCPNESGFMALRH